MATLFETYEVGYKMGRVNGMLEVMKKLGVDLSVAELDYWLKKAEDEQDEAFSSARKLGLIIPDFHQGAKNEEPQNR